MPKLRALEPGEKPQKRLSVTEAAALNDHREMLVALRARIARSVEAADCPPVALAALSRRLEAISHFPRIERLGCDWRGPYC